MFRWQHRLNGHEFEQTLGNSEGQGSLECCNPWGHKESDIVDQLNNNNNLVNEEWLMSLMNLGNKMGMCHGSDPSETCLHQRRPELPSSLPLFEVSFPGQALVLQVQSSSGGKISLILGAQVRKPDCGCSF